MVDIPEAKTIGGSTSFELISYGISIVALLLSVALSGLRIAHGLSFSEPLQTFTSGCEEESLFAIWKWLHGQSVYNYPTQLPFSGSFFNWSFYAFYGSVTQLLFSIFKLGDPWITQVAKWITLWGTVVLGFACYKVIREAANLEQHRQRAAMCFTAVAVGLYVASSPHIGFWMITARPDVWALAMEVGGLFCYLRYLTTGRRAWLVQFLLFAYLAWSFKHVNVAFAAACILDCALRRKLRLSLLLAGALGMAFIATLAIGPPEFRYMLLHSQKRMGFELKIGIQNFVTALTKSTLAWVPWLWITVGIGIRCAQGKSVFAEASLRVLHLATWIALGLYLPLSCKHGASDNYFLPFATAAILTWVPEALSRPHPKWAFGVFAGGVLCIIGCLTVLSGKRGVIDVGSTHRELLEVREMSSKLQEPVLVWDNLSSLPWINERARHHLVLASTYYYYRPEELEAGGVEGLVSSGYFSTVIDRLDVHRQFCQEHLDPVPNNNSGFHIYRRRAAHP